MELLTKARVRKLIEQQVISIENRPASGDVFLDDFRIGLRLRETIFALEGRVDVSNVYETNYQRFPLTEVTFFPNRLYLGISQETIRLPENVLGIMNTRSTYARIGMELARSSFIVAPGFGSIEPTPLVFEMTVLTEMRNLNTNEYYGFLMLFELDKPVQTSLVDYWRLFPLPNLGIGE